MLNITDSAQQLSPDINSNVFLVTWKELYNDRLYCWAAQHYFTFL